jgi:arylsulfatase
MVPTVLDALGIAPPATIHGVTQSPLDGVSLRHTFDDPKAASTHVTQYFEMMGHRSLYHDGWRAVCPWPGTSFTESGRKFGDPMDSDTLTALDGKGWELYHVAEDPAETTNLGDSERARLIAMIGLWYNEAGKYHVLPIDSRGTQRIAEERPQMAASRNRYVLFPGTQSIPAAAAPRILNRPYSINAEVEIPKDGAEGVLLSMGGNDGGISLYMQQGKLCFVHNYAALEHFYVKSSSLIPAGRHFLSMESRRPANPRFRKARGRRAMWCCSLTARRSARARSQSRHPFVSPRAARCRSVPIAGAAVTPEYQAPFRFTGTIRRVIVDVSGEHVVDHEAEMRMPLAKQ